jgi:hypothetical protein
MTRIIIIAVVGLLVGIGGGSGIALSTAKHKFVADSVARTQLAKDGAADGEAPPSTVDDAHPDGVMAGEHASTGQAAALPSLPAPLATVATSKPAGGREGAVGTAAQPPAPTPAPNAARQPAADTARANSPLQTGKLAKIFAAMPPKEAARVLEQLEDSDVTMILSAVSEKQAAAILSNIAPQRAAAISRAAVRGSREGR